MAQSIWESADGEESILAQRLDALRPAGMTADRFEGIITDAVRAAALIAAGRPRVAIICPTIDEFTALRGSLGGCQLVPPAQLQTRSFRPIAMNYWVSEIPTTDYFGTPTGTKEPVVCAHVDGQGLTSTAFAVTALLHAFPTVNHVILCGVAAGVPTPPPTRSEWEKTVSDAKNLAKAYRRLQVKYGETDVRLGDIVVGEAAVQFDFGKAAMTGFVPRGQPIRGCEQLKTVNDRLFEQMKSTGQRPWDAYLDLALAALSQHRTLPTTRPSRDLLHRHQLVRDPETHDLHIVTDPDPLPRGVPAHKVPKGRPNVFRGKIGSSDMVMKDSRERDKIGRIHGVGAVEMEGTAAMEAATRIGGCKAIIIRGICDYADADKNDDWWMYAACAAGAYSRCLVERLHLQLDAGL